MHDPSGTNESGPLRKARSATVKVVEDRQPAEETEGATDWAKVVAAAPRPRRAKRSILIPLWFGNPAILGQLPLRDAERRIDNRCRRERRIRPDRARRHDGGDSGRGHGRQLHGV